MLSTFRLIVLSLSLVSAAYAQQPQVLHGELSTQAVGSSLSATLDTFKSSASKTWIGYSIPTNAPYRNGWSGNRVTYLEGDSYRADIKDTHRQETTSADHAILLMRISAGHVDKLRSAANDEAIDAGGQRFMWLTGVTPEESVATLQKLILAAGKGETVDSGVFLLSLHKSNAVVPALIALTASTNPEHTREQAAFWLASQRGREGFLAVQKMLHEPGVEDASFRQKLTFDLTLCNDQEATTELIRVAHQDPSPGVRRQAQFWMATRGGKLVAGSLRDSADHDPDADTRKQAVFAISRLPDGEATAQLAQLVDTSKYPEVRKQAVFWLGQSSDPKALDYLSKLLTAPARP